MVMSGTEAPPTCCSNLGQSISRRRKKKEEFKKGESKGMQGKFKKNKDYFKLRIMERFSGKELKKWIWKLALLVIFKE